MRKKITTIFFIILFIALFAVGFWYIARNKATKSGQVPPTFKEFLGIGPSQKPGSSSQGGELSSDFTGGESGNEESTGSQGGTVPTPTIGTSVFTNIGYTPTTLPPVDYTPGGGGQTGGGSTGGGGTVVVGSGGGIITPPPADPNLPECGPADLNINFTQDEIDRLNALKSRFMKVAETLNTDADVATELANYDTFKIKTQKLTELNTYCINSPVYTGAQATVVASQPYGTVVPGGNGEINYRVPTPFWHDSNKDNQALVHQGSNFRGIFSDPDTIFPERSMEHALRLNLW